MDWKSFVVMGLIAIILWLLYGAVTYGVGVGSWNL